MNKLAVCLLLIATTLLTTACKNNNSMIDIKSHTINNNQNEITKVPDSNKKLNTMKIPINIGDEEEKKIIYVEINENSSLQEKMEIIVNTVSKQCFNGLPMNVKVYANNRTKVELIEPKEPNKSRITWEDDYLNEYTKEYTVNTIIKNIIQEEYKGEWIEKVQLYYEDELIQFD